MSGLAGDPGTEMTLRFEIFPSDLDAVVDFYTRVLRFSVSKDQRDEPSAYVSMQRGAVRVGAGPGRMTTSDRPWLRRSGKLTERHNLASGVQRPHPG